MSTKMGTNIRAVILDYGAVLSEIPNRAEWARMEAKFGVDPEIFQELWMRNRPAFDLGELTSKSYWSKLGEDAGRKMADSDIHQLMDWDIEMWGRENKIMVEWRHALRAAGIKVGLLSNMHPDMIKSVKDKFAWLRDFEFVAFSADIKMTKPDIKIYEYTLKEMNIRPEYSLFIDDRVGNIEAARSIGMNAIQFDSVAQLRQDLQAMDFPVLPEGPARNS